MTTTQAGDLVSISPRFFQKMVQLEIHVGSRLNLSSRVGIQLGTSLQERELNAHRSALNLSHLAARLFHPKRCWDALL